MQQYVTNGGLAGLDLTKAVLREVAVESKRMLYAEALHDREAGGVGVREALVVVPADDVNSSLLIRRRNPFNREPTAVKAIEKPQGV